MLEDLEKELDEISRNISRTPIEDPEVEALLEEYKQILTKLLGDNK